MEQSALFEPVTLGSGTVIRNRIAMAPMTTWSANDDGNVSNEEEAYYRRRANGVGLVITGCTHVEANGVGFTGEFAAYDDAFIPSLKRLADAAKSGGAPAILQIFHAGSKTLPELVSDPVAASAVEGGGGPFASVVVPRALSPEEIELTILAFGQAVRRAIAAGFDGVELHGAHGFLVQNFFSPHFNRREDQWGGSLENRMRFPLAVVSEMRRTIAAYADRPFILGYRISPEEGEEGGLRIGDSLVLIDRLIKEGIDYLHASLGNALEASLIEAPDTLIVPLLAEHVAGRVPLVAAGQLRTPQQAQQAIELGLSMVAIGQGLVMNPDWVELAREGRSDEIALAIAPREVPDLSIPTKLWTVIEGTPGWFAISQEAA